MADQFKWPWVSRHRLEQAERSLEEANKERRELLDRLLGNGAEARELRAQARRVEQVEDAEEPMPAADQGNIEQFTTPFDRVERRFDLARKTGALDPKFKARA